MLVTVPPDRMLPLTPQSPPRMPSNQKVLSVFPDGHTEHGLLCGVAGSVYEAGFRHPQPEGRGSFACPVESDTMLA